MMAPRLQKRAFVGTVVVLAAFLLGTFFSSTSTAGGNYEGTISRYLRVDKQDGWDHNYSANVVDNDFSEVRRRLDALSLDCKAMGMQSHKIDWRSVTIDPTINKEGSSQILRPFNLDTSQGPTMKLTTRQVGSAVISKFGQLLPDSGSMQLWVESGASVDDVIDPTGDSDPDFPTSGHVSVELELDQPLDGLVISIAGIDSSMVASEVARIHLFDEHGDMVKCTATLVTGNLKVLDKIAYEEFPGAGVELPGPQKSFYCMAYQPVKKIVLDQSIYLFDKNDVGKLKSRGASPAHDFEYCSGTNSQKPQQDDTTSPSTTGKTGTSGVNGDPLIMGLSGQLFKFEGRSGAWYSAISSPSFQWNMKVQTFDTCPEHDNNFVTGVGLNFFDRTAAADGNHTSTERNIQVNVVNPYAVNIGCGSSPASCLGGGSLEIILDGVKINTGGNYPFPSSSMLDGIGGHVLAFNTFGSCSRRWYDFDAGPSAPERLRKLVQQQQQPSPRTFAVIEGLKDTMVDKDVCSEWLELRKKRGDLFDQPGLYSTIIINTGLITLHIEYKQEMERCNAHSLDVWISSVSHELLDEKWEGVIGETKSDDYDPTKPKKTLSRKKALKYPDDEAYEVNSPFSQSCKGCSPKRGE